jgi:hypothetical protein
MQGSGTASSTPLSRHLGSLPRPCPLYRLMHPTMSVARAREHTNVRISLEPSHPHLHHLAHPPTPVTCTPGLSLSRRLPHYYMSTPMCLSPSHCISHTATPMLHERTVGTVPYPHSHGCEPYTHHFANSHAPTSSHLVPWPTLAPSPISLSSGGGVAIVPLALALTFPVRHRHDGHNCTHHAVVPLARALTRPSPHPGQVGTAQHAQLRRYAVAPLAHTHTHPRPHSLPPSPSLTHIFVGWGWWNNSTMSTIVCVIPLALP